MRKTLEQERQDASQALGVFLAELFKALRFPQLCDWLNKKFFK